MADHSGGSRLFGHVARATSRREEAPDTHARAPLANNVSRTDPEQETLLADSVGLALLIVLDRLDPTERLAFVLHDMFAVPPGFEIVA
jgi:RNA polymerase sigma-70 factor (ECF subfamily)